MRELVSRFEIEHPDAFPGDAVSLLQCIYRDQSLQLDVRIDAAGKAARFERPALAATLTASAPLPATPAAMEHRIAELLRKGLTGGVTVIDG